MDDAERLALQKEILAANGDDAKMREIAVRHGVDPDLWKFWVAQRNLMDTLTEAVRPLLEGILRALNKLAR